MQHGFPFKNDERVVCVAPTCRKEHWDLAFRWAPGPIQPLIREHFREIARFHWMLCGGMSLSALRRFNRGQSPPMPNFSPELKKELVRCQLDTLFSQTPHTWARFIKWQAQPDKPHIVALSTIGFSTKEEWKTLKNSLDNGRPRIIGLIRVGPTNNPTKAQENHQVLAIGYKQNLYNNEVEIFMYDPNHPNKTSRILLNTGLPENAINAVQLTPAATKVRGFFVVEVSGN